MHKLDRDRIWQLLLALRRQARNDADWPLNLDADGSQVVAENALWTIRASGWRCQRALSEDARELLELYLPLFQPELGRGWVLAHLGQSLDGCIAAGDGSSLALNDAPNIDHLHRLRALSDAILVGAGTVAADDPRLTTRRVPGPNPVRVVLDPQLRLAPDRRLFHDGMAPTLLVGLETAAEPRLPDPVELIRLPERSGGLEPAQVLAALRARGLRRVFIEGGGITVSRFLRAGLLDRLQIAVAPLLLGAGRPGVRWPAVDGIDQALRPACRRFSMGRDVLFDFDLRDGQANRSP